MAILCFDVHQQKCQWQNRIDLASFLEERW